MTTVCTCDPDVNWTRFTVERVSDFLELCRQPRVDIRRRSVVGLQFRTNIDGYYTGW